MKLSFHFILLQLSLIATIGYGYKVLVTVVGMSSSHNLFMYRLAEILGEHGNDVTILRKEIFPETKTPKLKHSREISYDAVNDTQVMPKKQFIRVTQVFICVLQALKALDEIVNGMTWETEDGGFDFKKIGQMKLMMRTFSDDCKRLLKNDQLMTQLKSEKFDVIIIHVIDFCSHGMAEALGIKGTIWMSSAFMTDPFAWYSGSPSNPSYVVSAAGDSTDHMNFGQRIQNTLSSTALLLLSQYGIVWTYDEIFQERYGNNFPTLSQLLYKTQLFFINADPFFELPRPAMHNVIYVGGLTMKNAEPLTEEWQKIVDNSGEHGVVVFSLGSVAKTEFMPLEMKTAFINAFKRIPQKVIWRLEGDTNEAKKVPNILVTDWFPQKDLLGHPKVKAFITHGGYNSLTEATYLGVPLIMFPLFADQHANVKRVERLKVGVTLPRTNLTEESIIHALNSVLNSDEIQQNAKRLGNMIRNKPESSRDLAVKWVEFLAEYQNLDQLKPASIDLSLVQYFLIDIYFTFLLTFVISSFIAFKCCKCCCKKVFCNKRKQKHD